MTEVKVYIPRFDWGLEHYHYAFYNKEDAMRQLASNDYIIDELRGYGGMEDVEDPVEVLGRSLDLGHLWFVEYPVQSPSTL